MTADHDTDTRRVGINLVTNIVSAYSDDREGARTMPIGLLPANGRCWPIAECPLWPIRAVNRTFSCAWSSDSS
jgi:hypothetical protein